LKPNLRHSKEGQKIVKSKQKLDEMKRQIQQEDQSDEEGENEMVEEVYGQQEPKRDYLELFPNIPYEKDVTRGPSVAKLRGDDVHIVGKLIKKYGDDIDRMFKDIKTNVMQWSKSEL
jgi:hypothetical protein